MFTFDQVRAFVAVAEELHFGRAAARLQMTQPPLSRQIQKLERAVGARLLERDQRSVALTAAGEAFLADARRLLATADTALLRARRVESGATGTVRLAFTAGSALLVLPGVLATAADALPGVQLDLDEMVTSDQVRLIEDGTVDVGIARPPAGSTALASHLLHREGLLVAVPQEHPFARTDRAISLNEVVGEPLIMYSPAGARYFHDLVMRLLPAPGPTVAYTVTQVLTMLSLVADGRGVALVPESSRRLRLSGVVYRELRGVRGDPVRLHLLWSKQNRNPAARALVEQLLTSFVAPSV